MTRRLVYYIAASLDGRIAGPGGESDFFPLDADLLAAMNAEQPETIPTAFRAAVGIAEDAPNLRFDTVLMGRATWQVGADVGVLSPYQHLRQVVFSRKPAPEPKPDTATASRAGGSDGNGAASGTGSAVEWVSADPAEFVRGLKAEDGLDLWLCGGGKLAGALLPEIDEIRVKRYPVLAGAGLPLIDAPFDPATFVVTDVQHFPSGADIVTYRRTA